MPLKCLNHTPYSRLYNKVSSIDHLKTYGCLCFISTYKVHRTKLDPRAVAGIFLGYTNTTKGYGVYDLKHNSVLISRDVVFHESIFSFHILNKNQETQSDFLHIYVPNIQSPVYSSDMSNDVPIQHSTENWQDSAGSNYYSDHFADQSFFRP